MLYDIFIWLEGIFFDFPNRKRNQVTNVKQGENKMEIFYQGSYHWKWQKNSL